MYRRVVIFIIYIIGGFSLVSFTYYIRSQVRSHRVLIQDDSRGIKKRSLVI
jgi:hypothetical protein